jgi:UDPglucose 6-dehydrogenase
MAHPVIVDLRNIYRPDEIAARGFLYESIGRPSKPVVWVKPRARQTA